MKLNIFGDDLEDVIIHLIEEDFLNETRFSEAFVRGKFNIKHWGKIKISIELKKRQISTYIIRKALEEIDDEEYLKIISTEAIKYFKKIEGKGNSYILRNKTIAHLMRKGFELEIIQTVIAKSIDFNQEI